ncbi:MAG: hypothetical protein ABR508_01240 [Candidatus Baltobacteraceae bacterium]
MSACSPAEQSVKTFIGHACMRQLGLLLPCSVVVQERDANTIASAVDAQKSREESAIQTCRPFRAAANPRLRHVTGHRTSMQL